MHERNVFIGVDQLNIFIQLKLCDTFYDKKTSLQLGLRRSNSVS